MNPDPGLIKPIRMVIFDVDGVLTDGHIFIDNNGVETKAFDVRDGSGIKWLRRAGLDVAFITGRESRVVEYRARELGVEWVYQGVKVKTEAYEDLLAATGLKDREAAYAGDDLIDLPVMRRVGLAMAPADARPEVLEVSHFVSTCPGGRGAAREMVEMILKGQGCWGEITSRYFE